MLLPDNIARTNNQVYEEVNIPATEPAPANLFGDLIKISELDEVREIQ